MWSFIYLQVVVNHARGIRRKVHYRSDRIDNLDNYIKIFRGFFTNYIHASTLFSFQHEHFCLKANVRLKYISRFMTKPTKWSLLPAKTQISLDIHPVWSQSSMCAQWVGKDPSFFHADVQADLSLRWAHMLFCWFCHEAAHISQYLLFFFLWCNVYMHIIKLCSNKTDSFFEAVYFFLFSFFLFIKMME